MTDQHLDSNPQLIMTNAIIADSYRTFVHALFQESLSAKVEEKSEQLASNVVISASRLPQNLLAPNAADEIVVEVCNIDFINI